MSASIFQILNLRTNQIKGTGAIAKITKENAINNAQVG